MGTKIYEIARDEKTGRYLKACEDIQEGSLIIKEAPLVIGPQESGVVFCFNCNKILNTTKIPVCSKCKTASVCTGNCRGNGHTEEECAFLGECPIQCGHILVNSQLILPLRCLNLRSTDSKKWEEFLLLESHLEKRRNKKNWRDIGMGIEALFLNMGIISQEDVEKELVQKICGILDVNTFEIRNSEIIANFNSGPTHALRGLYLKASLLNHDCIGNTHLAMDDDNNLIIHASTNIPQKSSIYFNYANPLKGSHERRLTLKEAKYFECFCKRCSDPSELGTEISSLKCPRCKQGFVRPQSVDQLQSWSCSKCQRIFSRALIHSTLVEARILINSLSNPDVTDFEKLLRKLLKTFSPNHYIILELKQNLIGMYTQCEPKVKNLQRKIELCEELLPVFQTLEPGVSRMQGITLYELQSAKVLLAEKQAKNKEIDVKVFIKVLQTGESLLKQSIKHLLHEPKCSPEGRLCVECFKELKGIRSLIVELESSPEDSKKRKKKGNDKK